MDGDVVLDMVNHFNEEAITLPSNNSRPWKLAVYSYNALGVAQPCHILQLDLWSHSKMLKEDKRKIN
jgi:hypothetical protein